MVEAVASEGKEPDGSPDTASFDRLYREMVDHVYAYAAARLGDTDGEDLTAEVFHAAVVAFRDGRAAQVTPAWLMSVTKNKVIDRWRAAGRRKAKAHLLLVRDEGEWPDSWSDGTNRQLVIETLDRLQADVRVLLVLRHVDGMSVGEIANAAGKSVTAIDSKLARARRAFRREYEKLEAGSHG